MRGLPFAALLTAASFISFPALSQAQQSPMPDMPGMEKAKPTPNGHEHGYVQISNHPHRGRTSPHHLRNQHRTRIHSQSRCSCATTEAGPSCSTALPSSPTPSKAAHAAPTSSSPPTGSCPWPLTNSAPTENTANSPSAPCSPSNPPPSPAVTTPSSSSRAKPHSANPSSTASTRTTFSWN